MANTGASLGCLLESIRRTVAVSRSEPLTDHVLLQRYVRAGDESAFAELVQRYAPLVMGLCWRILRHRQDAEDAFQAVFLVLARKAGTIRQGDPRWPAGCTALPVAPPAS
jgi:hypothetical protein